MSVLCQLFGVTKQAYYKYDENRLLKRVAQEQFAVTYINEVRKKDPGIGGKKLWYMYKRDFTGNKPLGRDLFEDVIDKYGLKQRKRQRKPRTTDSMHGLPTYPNIVKNFIPTAPNQLWVSDITYIKLWTMEELYHFCYLSLILDAYSEEIVGYSIGDSLDTKYPMEALKMALHRFDSEPEKAKGLIHHSDRGCQYASHQYVSMLKEKGIKISMTESGDPKDNAQAERINNTMKNELLMDIIFTDMAAVEQAVGSAVQFYNYERPHMSINMMTPHEASRCTGEIPKLWVSLREKYIKEDTTPCTIPV